VDQILQNGVGQLRVNIRADGLKSGVKKIHGPQGIFYLAGIGGDFFGDEEAAIRGKAGEGGGGKTNRV
jgi:hypothetical protein